MLDRRTFTGLAAAAGAVSASQPVLAVANRSRQAEAAALIRFAEQTHPRGLEAKADPHWRRLAAKLMASAGSAPVAVYIVRAKELLAWFKDGHTTLWTSMLKAGPFGLDMPVRAAAFYDGLYVTEASASLQDLLGAKVTRLGSVPIEQVMSRFAAVWPANNVAWPHHDAPLLLNTPGVLHGLEIAKGADLAPISIEASIPDGPVRRQLVPAKSHERSKLKRTQALREAWTAEAKSGNYVRRLADQRALYVSLDDLSTSIDDFMKFTLQIFAAMDEPGWTKLIVDLRRNPGGNNFLGEPLRKHIERSRFNRPGGFYVLIGPTTFSAAQNLVNRLERETFAIFAGEPTGGAPNHYGDAKRFEAGTILQGGVSTLPWFDSYPMDKRSWVMPDLLIPRTFADWAAGRDTVLDAVLADRTSATADDMTEERVFYYSRKSQSAEWRPYWLA